jgi:hypothetical protein
MGLHRDSLRIEGQVRFLFGIWANYRAVFKAKLKRIKAILKFFKGILK